MLIQYIMTGQSRDVSEAAARRLVSVGVARLLYNTRHMQADVAEVAEQPAAPQKRKYKRRQVKAEV